MSKITTTLAAAALAGATSSIASTEATTMRFQITGAYSFADTYDIMARSDGVIARAGRLTGSWRLIDIATKASGNAHLNAATALRIVPGEAPSLIGTMELAMSEHHNTAPGTDILWLAYEATSFEQIGANTTIVRVEGRVVGGRGRYAGAKGDISVVSVNGFIEDGRMNIHFAV
jgi:hypothetical protein